MLFRLGSAALVFVLAVSAASAGIVDLRASPPLAPLGPHEAGAPASPALEARAADLSRQYALQLPAAQAQAEDLFAGLGEVTARAKSPESVAAKLQARGVDASDAASVSRALRDGVGVRLTLSDSSPQAIERLVARLGRAFENGRLAPESVSNFRASEGGLPYLDEAQMARLARSAAAGGAAPYVRPAEKSLIPAGYTAVHLNVVFAGGVRGEIQIRGPRVHALAEREHASYDARRGKRPRQEAETAIAGLDERQNAVYLAYLSALYRHARRVETLGAAAAGPAPLFPKRLSRRLDLSLAAP